LRTTPRWTPSFYSFGSRRALMAVHGRLGMLPSLGLFAPCRIRGIGHLWTTGTKFRGIVSGGKDSYRLWSHECHRRQTRKGDDQICFLAFDCWSLNSCLRGRNAIKDISSMKYVKGSAQNVIPALEVGYPRRWKFR
jgi:hypothetical protein